MPSHLIFRAVLDPDFLSHQLTGLMKSWSLRPNPHQTGVPLNMCPPIEDELRPLTDLVHREYGPAEYMSERSSFRIQPPDNTGLGWHQDLRAVNRNGLTCWVPLTGGPTLEVGTAILGEVEHTSDKRNYAVMTEPYSGPSVVLDLKPGDVAFIYPLTPHRTFIPEGCTQTRMSLDVRYRACAPEGPGVKLGGLNLGWTAMEPKAVPAPLAAQEGK